tara:strand:+ start:640 stop:1245 length:606 start_codon:yes stop_codon:yes gene_type:complete
MNDFTNKFLEDSKKVISKLDIDKINYFVDQLNIFKTEKKGRIFFAGSGGGAGHASHAAADFRKLLDLECYSITDNVSELTARINDDGWETSYSNYLKSSRFNDKDAVFIFSVGGGSVNPDVSVQLINVAKYTKDKNGMVFSIVGKDGGEVNKLSDASIIIPTVDESMITAHTEGMQAYLWHFLVSHPKLNPNIPRWEGLEK